MQTVIRTAPRRKDVDASPYINHPIALATVLGNEGGIPDLKVRCAAVLSASHWPACSASC